VHILINNAAIACGDRVDETTIQTVKTMMDTNFVAYAHFIILFLRQAAVATAAAHRF
jgi:NADP-dependent 3-hydroxy acid dehydrogenase YdfG